MRINSICYLCKLPLFITTHGICSVCLKRIPLLKDVCLRCGLKKENTDFCYFCESFYPEWSQLIAVSDYCFPLNHLISQFKNQNKLFLSKALARILVLFWLEKYRFSLIEKPDLLLTIPSSKFKKWKRGFDQMELIGHFFSKWTKIEYKTDILAKKNTKKEQKILSINERIFNIKNRFFTLNNEKLKGKRVLLLDDIVTTGATIQEASKVLRENGAKSIDILCICRTL